MSEDFVFADTGDGSYGPNFGALVGQDNYGDYVEEGMVISYDSGAPAITKVTAGRAYITRRNVSFTDNDNNTRDRLQTNNLVQISERTSNISLTDGTVNNIYLRGNIGGTDSPTIEVDPGTINDEDLKIAEIDTSSDTVTQFNRKPSADFRDVSVTGDIIDAENSTTIWDNGNEEISNSALPSIDAGSLNLSNDFESTGGSLDLSTDSVTTDELDESIAPTWSSTHTFSSTIVDDGGQTIWNGSSIPAGAINLGTGLINDNSSVDLDMDVQEGTNTIGSAHTLRFDANLTVEDKGSGIIEVDAQSSTDTTTDLSNNGTTVVNQTDDINFTDGLTASSNQSVFLEESYSATWTSSHTWDTGSSANLSLDENGLTYNTNSPVTMDIQNLDSSGSLDINFNGSSFSNVGGVTDSNGNTLINNSGVVATGNSVSVSGTRQVETLSPSGTYQVAFSTQSSGDVRYSFEDDGTNMYLKFEELSGGSSSVDYDVIRVR